MVQGVNATAVKVAITAIHSLAKKKDSLFIELVRLSAALFSTGEP